MAMIIITNTRAAPVGIAPGMQFMPDTARPVDEAILKGLKGNAAVRGLFADGHLTGLPVEFFDVAVAPNVEQLTLADARTGQVLRTRMIQATQLHSLARSNTASDPWQVLDTTEKVQRLRDLLQRELAREVPELLRA